MTLHELQTTKREQILYYADRSGARNVRIFGSVARGDNDARSDIDFLVDLEPGRSLLHLIRLRRTLEALLDTTVDVVSSRGLRERMRQKVMAEAVPL